MVHTINSSHGWFLALHKVDELSKEPFKIGDQIVICSKCKKVHLAASWSMLGEKCIQCKQTETKRVFSPDDFKTKINIASNTGAERAVREQRETFKKWSERLEREAREQRVREERARRQREEGEREAREHRKKRLKIIAAAAALILVIFIWPKGNKIPAADPTPSTAEAVQAVPYSYVTSYGLNVRSGPSPQYGVVIVLYENARVQLIEGSGNISGAWRKIRIGNYEGWVDSSYLQTITITGLEVGNSNKDGDWITPPGAALNAKDIRYLKPVITYNAWTSGEVTFYVNVIYENGDAMRNTNSSAGFTVSTRGNIRGGTGNSFILSGWGREEGGAYLSGVYTIEVWYNGVCLCSKNVRLN